MLLSLFVKISINDLQALISIQLTKLTVFYTANMHEAVSYTHLTLPTSDGV